MHITHSRASGARTHDLGRSPWRVVVGAVVALVFVGVCASAALAHVTVNPKEASQGGFTKLAFRVPNERDNAGTTKISVQLPPDHPIAHVSVRPVPGWTAEVKKKTLTTPVKTESGEVTEAVDTITWTGGQIEPGQFQEFEISAGPLPTDTNELVFPAIQTYSNGEEVAWIEKPTPGGPEPDHPAPVLTLTPSTGGHGGGGTTTTTAGGTQQVAASPASSTSTSDSSSIAWIGVALGALALVAAIVALARGNRSSA
jgi:uncharacterized protein YcnI